MSGRTIRRGLSYGRMMLPAGSLIQNLCGCLPLPDCRQEPFHLYHPFALQTLPQASALFAAFPLRERLILKLCGLAGLRPGEALALQWHDLRPDGLHISRRVYRGKLFGLKLER